MSWAQGDRAEGDQSNISRGDAISRAYRPATLDEARAIVAAAPRIRVLGTRHSFSGIGESGELPTPTSTGSSSGWERSHWGKLFVGVPRYERLPDFAALAARLDRRGAFRNRWLERVLCR